MNDIESVKAEIATGDPFVMAGAMVTIGKKFLKEFRPLVLACIHHEHPLLRIEAMAALTFYWEEKEFEPVVHEWIASDPDEENRERAMGFWATYYLGKGTKWVLSELVQYATDSTRPIKFRAVAVKNFFRVKYGSPSWSKHYPASISDAVYVSQSEEEFQSLVPWDELRPYMKS